VKDYFYVYRLRSLSDSSQIYTGQTRNLQARLEKHNRGDCSHTAKFVPWKIETAIAFSCEQKAIDFERYLKTGSGREFSRRHF
jgi:predicted GIY-YIG superfamily endonuclease